jgi:hypothetical protein
MMLGVVASVLCLGFVVAALFSGGVSLVFLGFMLLGAAVGWVLFTRPSVVITLQGVHLNNPVRRTVVPWCQLQDVSARWNLEVYANDRAYPAWAIASHIERPASPGLLGMGSLGRRAQLDAGPPPAHGTTVGSAARLIEDAKDEWTELAAEGRPEAVTGDTVTRTWQPLDIAALLGPTVLIVVGLLV